MGMMPGSSVAKLYTRMYALLQNLGDQNCFSLALFILYNFCLIFSTLTLTMQSQLVLFSVNKKVFVPEKLCSADLFYFCYILP